MLSDRSCSCVAVLVSIFIRVVCASAQRHDLVTIGEQRLDALLDRIEELAAAPREPNPLLESLERTFEREISLFELFDHPLQPIEDPVDPLWLGVRGGSVFVRARALRWASFGRARHERRSSYQLPHLSSRDADAARGAVIP
jgi:hypothetical protein